MKERSGGIWNVAGQQEAAISAAPIMQYFEVQSVTFCGPNCRDAFCNMISHFD
jgi:hypothetical protein